MKKSESIKLNREFSAVCQRGRKYNGRYLSLFVRKNRFGQKRVGFATSRRFPNAVTRNRAKRVLRALYQELEAGIVPGSDVIILMKVLVEPGFTALRQDLSDLLTEAKLLED